MNPKSFFFGPSSETKVLAWKNIQDSASLSKNHCQGCGAPLSGIMCESCGSPDASERTVDLSAQFYAKIELYDWDCLCKGMTIYGDDNCKYLVVKASGQEALLRKL